MLLQKTKSFTDNRGCIILLNNWCRWGLVFKHLKDWKRQKHNLVRRMLFTPPCKAEIFTAATRLKVWVCTSSEVGAQARPLVEGVNNIFWKLLENLNTLDELYGAFLWWFAVSIYFCSLGVEDWIFLFGWIYPLRLLYYFAVMKDK